MKLFLVAGLIRIYFCNVSQWNTIENKLEDLQLTNAQSTCYVTNGLEEEEEEEADKGADEEEVEEKEEEILQCTVWHCGADPPCHESAFPVEWRTVTPSV